MTQLSDTFYLVLKPTKRFGLPINGQRPVQAFAVGKLRRERPFTDRGELAVRVTLKVDSKSFDAVIPHVEIELEESELFANVRVEAEAEDDA